MLTFSWTYTHLYHPDPDDNEGGIEGWIIKRMSLPRNMGSTRKQFYFTIFYSTATVFSFMNTLIYWLITRSHDAGADQMTVLQNGDETLFPIPDTPFSDLFGAGWFKPFVVCNLHTAPTIVMVIETLFFNSIKRPFALGSHIFGLMGLAGTYLGWGGIGKLTTGCYPFHWMDFGQMGSIEAVTVSCSGFVLLAPIMYTMMQGLVGCREGFTKTRPLRETVNQVLDR